MWSANRPYLPRLDIVRGLAAWWVVAYHGVQLVPTGGVTLDQQLNSKYPPIVIASQGWLAVSLFVMISGFSLAQGLRGHSISWSGYLRARWFRVAPLYLFLLAIGVLVAAPPGTEALTSILASVTLLPLPGAFTPSPWMSTVWSVRVEFMLYLTLPALVYVFTKYSRRSLVIGGPLLLLAVFVLMVRSGSPMINILYWGFFGRFVEFTIGFALGFVGFSRLTKVIRTVAGWGGLALLICLSYLLNRSGGIFFMPDSMRIVAFVGTAVASLALIAWTTDPAAVSTNWVTRVMGRMGLWSYSTYMWHFAIIMLVAAPLFTTLQDAGFAYPVSLALGLLVLAGGTALVSWLSFDFIERPFLSLRPKYVKDAEPALAT